jgi:hypothetical protein|tara:strand:- start:19579 stop:20184 length:606 start_codon:yes stop_codon:yes gene_type:complete
MKITISELKQIIQEEIDSLNEGGYGEGSMARSQLGRTAELALMLQDMIGDDTNLEEWVESKITKSQDYLSSVLNYMRGEQLSEGYYSKGKCVYKKEDNSKVGCTDGPVKDYLAALYANVGDANESKLEEGLEQLTPENVELLFNVMKKMAEQPAIISALAMGGLAAAVNKMAETIKGQLPDPADITTTTSPTPPSETTETT